jgi:hypothetical protein
MRREHIYIIEEYDLCKNGKFNAEKVRGLYFYLLYAERVRGLSRF